MDDVGRAPARTLQGLRDPLVAHRKRTARALVGKLSSRGIEPIRDVFIEERSPEVYKWLGMALARSKTPGIGKVIRAKRNDCVDPNATDWLTAAEAVATPSLAATVGQKKIASREHVEQGEGAIILWGARVLTDESSRRLTTLAGEQDDPDLRRWSLLTLNAHGLSVPSGILLDNLSSRDFLLREWSLHVLARIVPSDARRRVLAIVEDDPAVEHPRVLEWAVHAASAYDYSDLELDRTLIDIHQLELDDGVGEACLAELGRRLNPPAVDYLMHICAAADDGNVLASMFALRDADGPPPPDQLMQVVADACDRIDPTDPGLRHALPRLPVGDETRRAVQRVLNKPGGRIYARATLMNLHEGDDVSEERLRVGVVVALVEEFEFMTEVISLEVTDHPISGNTYHVTTVGAPGQPAYDLIVRVVGDKGASFAVAGAEKLVADYEPHVLVSLGISGKVHPKDADLGDVVIGKSTTAYLDNFKAVPGVEGQFKFEAGTETFRSDADLVNRVEQLRIEDRVRYDAWLATETAVRVLRGAKPPQVFAGPIAAGPGVVASDEFKAFVRSQNRSFQAVDMESTGVGVTAWLDVRRTKLLMVRGISDGANKDKDELDASDAIDYRSLAMRAATSYLLTSLLSLTARGRLP